LSLRVFIKGQSWDVLDKVGKWCAGEIIDLKDNAVQVHYTGWSEKWDEFIARDSKRIAKAGKMTGRVDVPKHPAKAHDGNRPAPVSVDDGGLGDGGGFSRLGEGGGAGGAERGLDEDDDNTA